VLLDVKFISDGERAVEHVGHTFGFGIDRDAVLGLRDGHQIDPVGRAIVRTLAKIQFPRS